MLEIECKTFAVKKKQQRLSDLCGLPDLEGLNVGDVSLNLRCFENNKG